jgi:GcrA cell cycle regulator
MNRQIDPMETQSESDEDFMGPPAETLAAEADALDPKLPAAAATAAKKLITTIALTIDTCRWPFGDPVEADFHYCGELPLVGRPYCTKHDAQSYHATRPKKAAA